MNLARIPHRDRDPASEARLAAMLPAVPVFKPDPNPGFQALVLQRPAWRRQPLAGLLDALQRDYQRDVDEERAFGWAEGE